MDRASSRNQRNNPYYIEELAVTIHRSTAGLVWRWRTEITLLMLVLIGGWWYPARHIGSTADLIALAAVLGTLFGFPATRQWLIRHAWCTVTRHRLQKVCWEARLHTRAGRLPLILWITPTRVGERAKVLSRAGTSADDFDSAKSEIAAACYAREARITRNRRWSQVITIDIIRRDPLGDPQPVTSRIHDQVAALPARENDEAA